jgi:hypothetical protein
MGSLARRQNSIYIYKTRGQRAFQGKKKEYLKHEINELAMNSKNKNIRDLYRGINEFKRGYQPRNNLVKDENGDLLIFCICQILEKRWSG